MVSCTLRSWTSVRWSRSTCSYVTLYTQWRHSVAMTSFSYNPSNLYTIIENGCFSAIFEGGGNPKLAKQSYVIAKTTLNSQIKLVPAIDRAKLNQCIPFILYYGSAKLSFGQSTGSPSHCGDHIKFRWRHIDEDDVIGHWHRWRHRSLAKMT